MFSERRTRHSRTSRLPDRACACIWFPLNAKFTCHSAFCHYLCCKTMRFDRTRRCEPPKMLGGGRPGARRRIFCIPTIVSCRRILINPKALMDDDDYGAGGSVRSSTGLQIFFLSSRLCLFFRARPDFYRSPRPPKITFPQWG
jgi:hypothetical protein